MYKLSTDNIFYPKYWNVYPSSDVI
jgi:hypothetical protein